MTSKVEGVTEGGRSWADLPIEILELIRSSLPCSNYPYFASVCKRWDQATPVIYPANQSPILLHFKKIESGICHYYSPSANKVFCVDCAFDLTGYALFSGKDGWLLVYNDAEIKLVNPVSGISRQFPGLRHRTFFNGATFSGCPPNGCTIFLIDSWIEQCVDINIYNQEGWHEEQSYANNLPFALAPSSKPMFCDGRFYCLGKKGNLGVYDPVQSSWTVFAEHRKFDTSCLDSYLVESGGELMAVQIRNYGMSVHIFLLNRELMIWDEVQDLGDRSLFLGSKMSFLTTPLERKMRNKAYVSRFHGEPEIIEAEIKCSNGSLYFKPKSLSHYYNQQEDDVKFRVCNYSLANGECSEYSGSREYLYSIWFEAKHHYY